MQRVALTHQDFINLVGGGVVRRGDVEIMLQDIGFHSMVTAIFMHTDWSKSQEHQDPLELAASPEWPGRGGATELYRTDAGQEIHIHARAGCRGPCPFHWPSDHHMKEWPTRWQEARGVLERICPCGTGHPDPDDWRIRNGQDDGAHDCCGCCGPSGGRRPSGGSGF